MITEKNEIISPASTGHECELIQTAQNAGLEGVFTLIGLSRSDRINLYKSLNPGGYLFELPFRSLNSNIKKECFEKFGVSYQKSLTKTIQSNATGWSNIVAVEKW